MTNAPKDDVVVLGGHELKRVKNGLDEAEVASLINELINERDRLAQSQAYISSLSRLAERTVVEAEKLATQIKAEATEQAKADSAAIIDKAKEQARQMAEKKAAEALAIANEKANAIKVKAEEEAALLLENETNRIRDELRRFVNQQLGYLLEKLESLKLQAVAIKADLDNRLSHPEEEKSTITVKLAEKSDGSVAEITKESDTMVAEASKKTLQEHPDLSPAPDRIERRPEPSELLQIEEQPELGTPQWEVEILPPFDISEVMGVMAFLDQLPEVANTEMIVPQIDKPSILVFLLRPMNFVDMLKTIPAVAYVEELPTPKAATNGKPRKVRIGFSKKTTLPVEK
jgi:hypothetical protein